MKHCHEIIGVLNMAIKLDDEVPTFLSFEVANRVLIDRHLNCFAIRTVRFKDFNRFDDLTSTTDQPI